MYVYSNILVCRKTAHIIFVRINNVYLNFYCPYLKLVIIYFNNTVCRILKNIPNRVTLNIIL